MAYVIRCLFIVVILSCSTSLGAETDCSAVSKTRAAAKVRAAQLRALDFEAAPTDSGVLADVAPRLIGLKAALAEAADTELACVSVDEDIAKIQAGLQIFLAQAAPGMIVPEETKEDDAFKPVRGLFGNEVDAKVSLFGGPPRLLEVVLKSDVTCGEDSQLLVYEDSDGHWRRALRWSGDFNGGKGSGNSWTASFGAAWGDFFLTSILVPDPVHPEQWRAVVAHGASWCQSRFSGFGLALIAPSKDGDARVVWQTDRGFSRGDYEVRLRGSGDVFEFRVNADEMSFNPDNAFERLVVYRYRLKGDAVTRLEPVAGSARGFVEEWLSMPWDEARDQLVPGHEAEISSVHKEFESTRADQIEDLPDWRSGAVRACSAQGRFQVAMSVERTHYVQGKTGELPILVTTRQKDYYFQLMEDHGYRLLRITIAPEPGCDGPDLMKKQK